MKIRTLMIVLLVVLLVGCSATPGSDTPKPDTASESQSTSETSEISASTETSAPAEGITTAEATESATAGETANLSSMIFESPDKLLIESTYEASGISYKTKYYIEGKSYRMETNTEGMPFTLIYNSTTDMSYMVNDADKTVMPLDMGMGLGMMGSEEFTEESYESIDAIEKMFGNYELTTFEGEQVVYVEGEDEAGHMKLWISTKYGYPLKMELYSDGQLVMSSVSKLSTTFDSKGLFDPPADYQIIDLMNYGTEQSE